MFFGGQETAIGLPPARPNGRKRLGELGEAGEPAEEHGVHAEPLDHPSLSFQLQEGSVAEIFFELLLGGNDGEVFRDRAVILPLLPLAA
ncbi:unnamed protein product [Ectocarpus sp. CCAP 1310/34]|nr:unnamed protein product [Ectocarpus sp. CCAP 1310/34]